MKPIRFQKLTVALVALTITAFGCSKKSSHDTKKSDQETSAEQLMTGTVSVVSTTGAPVANARVMIGMSANVPFPGNILITDSLGQINPPADKWNDAQPVSIEAPGYIRATYFEVSPATNTFVLRRMQAAQQLQLNGETTGFGDLKKDGFADVGLVFRALPRSGIATFDVTALMSPEMDTMNVMGQNINIPSNVTVPKQVENYVIPITLNKPSYRAFFPNAGNYQVVSGHAKFPFKKTVDALRSGKNLFDVINDLEFVGASVTSLNIEVLTQTLNLAVDGVPFVKAISFTAPNYDSSFHLLAIAGTETNGLYYPSDVKTAAPGQQLMLTSPQSALATGIVIAALRKVGAPSAGAGSDEVTSVIMAAGSANSMNFMPIPKPPTFQAFTLSMDAPALPAGVDAALTYGVYDKITTVTQGTTSYELKTPQWDVYAPRFATSLTLPQMPAFDGNTATDKFRWEVLFGGVAKGTALPVPGPSALEKVSHVTRSAIDL
jgi:hypothetical protein